MSAVMIAPATSAVRDLLKIGDPAMPDPNIDLVCGLIREPAVWNDLREMVAADRAAVAAIQPICPPLCL
ncbi:hypothetical protein ACFQ4K_31155 [Tistrella bauzanensis]